ncbi:MAG TPA: hypothetical protein VNL35_15110 [Chloroflexota bacterium]|nr:hypothetical protein [Chloroflexota bacterium]
MESDLAKAATQSARAALVGWSPNDPDAVDHLARAIGQAVARGIEGHEVDTARHTALTMAGLPDDESPDNWQV